MTDHLLIPLAIIDVLPWRAIVTCLLLWMGFNWLKQIDEKCTNLLVNLDNLRDEVRELRARLPKGDE